MLFITCPEHGDFEQTADKHLHGQGCPVCVRSKTEATNLQRYGVTQAGASGCCTVIKTICRIRVMMSMRKDFGMSMKQIMFKDSATAHPVGWFDAVITCPPYYDTKVYTDSGVENLSYDEFLDWLDIVVKNFSNVNYFCFQINQKYKVDMCRIVVQNGFDFIQELTGKQKVSHFNRTLDKKKSEYESMLVYKKR